MDGEELGSPRVTVGGRQRCISSSSETGTPKTPKGSRFEDTRFFGSNFNLEALAEVASLQKTGISKYTSWVWLCKEDIDRGRGIIFTGFCE